MTTYAYYRVSTGHQDYRSQKLGVLDFCNKKKIIIDAEVIDQAKSGKLNPSKRNLGVLLNNLKKGDTIVCSEISRLGRSLLMIMDILKELMDKECKLYCVKENYELGDNIISKVLAFAFGLSAEIERNLISQRAKEGIARARQAGKKIGRKPGQKAWKLSKLEDYIRQLVNQGESISEICRRVGAHWNTVQKFCKDKGINTKNRGYSPMVRLRARRILNRTDLIIACSKYKQLSQVARYMGCAPNTVRKNLELYGITFKNGKGFNIPADIIAGVIDCHTTVPAVVN